MNKLSCIIASIGVVALLSACGESPDGSAPNIGPGAIAKATCGPGSNPETGLQGRVSRDDHNSGRAAEGYNCNTELVGSYTPPLGVAVGTIGGFKVQRYIDAAGNECAYYDTTLLYPTNAGDPDLGVNVLNMNDPSNPQLSTRLVSLAMQSPHESVVLSQETGVLAAVLGNAAFAPGVVDLYSLEPDCANPTLLNPLPLPVGVFGHESGMSPDGRFFYSASPGTPTLTAVDISNPLLPQAVWTGNFTSHGLSVSNDGTRVYASAGEGAGVLILDVSEIHEGVPNPTVTEVSRLSWDNQTIPQNALPFTTDGHEYLFEIDEYSANSTGGQVTAHGSVVGAARIINIDDEQNPYVVSDNLRLEVHEPENRDTIANDPGAQLPVQGYAGHYCNIDSRDNPKVAACSMIISGLRIFDISDPANPSEIAYYNAPVTARLTPAFEASNWAMSQPVIISERKEIWYSDGFQGFFVVRVTNDVWPD